MMSITLKCVTATDLRSDSSTESGDIFHVLCKKFVPAFVQMVRVITLEDFNKNQSHCSSVIFDHSKSDSGFRKWDNVWLTILKDLTNQNFFYFQI